MENCSVPGQVARMMLDRLRTVSVNHTDSMHFSFSVFYKPLIAVKTTNTTKRVHKE